MISLKNRSLGKNNQGFTIVELLIVIVVIGILALLVITTYSGIQSKARNDKRQVDLKSIQTQLEAFNTQNGYYPSFADLNGSAWRTTNMKGLDSGALSDPQNPTSTTLVTAPVAKSYAYQPVNSSGTSCESDDTTCVAYTLTANYEGSVNGATTLVKKNLN